MSIKELNITYLSFKASPLSLFWYPNQGQLRDAFVNGHKEVDELVFKIIQLVENREFDKIEHAHAAMQMLEPRQGRYRKFIHFNCEIRQLEPWLQHALWLAKTVPASAKSSLDSSLEDAIEAL